MNKITLVTTNEGVPLYIPNKNPNNMNDFSYLYLFIPR